MPPPARELDSHDSDYTCYRCQPRPSSGVTIARAAIERTSCRLCSGKLRTLKYAPPAPSMAQAASDGTAVAAILDSVSAADRRRDRGYTTGAAVDRDGVAAFGPSQCSLSPKAGHCPGAKLVETKDFQGRIRKARLCQVAWDDWRGDRNHGLRTTKPLLSIANRPGFDVRGSPRRWLPRRLRDRESQSSVALDKMAHLL